MKAICEDGKGRVFHQSGIYSLHGYVYEGGKRVYGKVNHNDPLASFSPHFTASGKHAWLTQPAPTAEQLASA